MQEIQEVYDEGAIVINDDGSTMLVEIVYDDGSGASMLVNIDEFYEAVLKELQRNA